MHLVSAVLIGIFNLVPLAYANKREISCFVEQKDSDTNEEIEVVHVIAEGKTDIVHYLWSTFALPSVLIARTSNTTVLNINITKLETFETDAITFSEQPFESIGLTISEIWKLVYNESQGNDSLLYIESKDLKSFNWTNMNSSVNCSKNYASATFEGKNDDALFSKKGTFEIQFSVSGDEVLSSEYPHLIFNGNSTQIKVTLDNLFSNASKIRYGLEVMLFSSPSKNHQGDWSKTVSYSVNDENSPGVFSDIELTLTGKSFITWRPVAYTGKNPTVANSSEAQMLSECGHINTTIPHSIAELYYESKSNFSAFNISFGVKGENYYPKTKYTSWSLMIGIGSAPKAKISPLVIIFMIAGLGVLLLFFIGGGSFLAYRKWFKKDDDLLLSKRSIN